MALIFGSIMSILKKFLSSNLSKYEDEQKKRYKKYMKIQKREAKVVQKTEAELYEDVIERQKSLRRSKRKAAVKEEIIFKEPNSGLSLGAGPALLEAINNYITIEKIPGPYLQEITVQYTFTRKENDKAVGQRENEQAGTNTSESNNEIKNVPPIPKRRRSRKSLDYQNNKVEVTDVKECDAPTTPCQEIIQKHQAIEIGRVSTSTINSEQYYDCIDELSDVFKNEEPNPSIVEHHTVVESPPKFLKEELTENGNENEEMILVEGHAWKPQLATIKESYSSELMEDPNTLESDLENTLQTLNSNYDVDIFISSDSDDDNLAQSFNDYVVIEPLLAQSLLKESQERTKLHDEIEKEKWAALKIESDMMTFSDNSDEEEATILDGKRTKLQIQNSRKGSSSSEGDVFEIKPNRKVNFDFGNSYCTTYEPIRQPSSSDETSLTSTTTDEDNHRPYNFSILGNRVHMEPPQTFQDATNYNREMYNQKDHVYQNFGVGLDQWERNSLEPIYENVKTMDLALLNCKNGYTETDNTDYEEVDQISENESMDFSINKTKQLQDYYDNIGDFQGDKGEIQVERQISLSEIQEDLSEIKKLDDVVTQIERIQDVLNKINSQIELLESTNDENYTSLLKTLLNSMKILGNLNCNFDEELLKFQHDSMANVSKCIDNLKKL